VVLKREPPTLCFLIDVVLDACLELCVCDVSFKLWRGLQALTWTLKWYWDAAFELCVLALQWCWDAAFDPCVLPLHKWLWLASRLKYELCYLMTGLQWFLDSLQMHCWTGRVVDCLWQCTVELITEAEIYSLYLKREDATLTNVALNVLVIGRGFRGLQKTRPSFKLRGGSGLVFETRLCTWDAKVTLKASWIISVFFFTGKLDE